MIVAHTCKSKYVSTSSFLFAWKTTLKSVNTSSGAFFVALGFFI